MKDALAALASSRKALVLVAAVGAAVAMVATHAITGTQALDFCKWVVGAWMASHAYQEANSDTAPPTGV